MLKKLFVFMLILVVSISTMLTQVSATKVTVLDGQVSVTDTADSNEVSGTTVTIKAKGSLFGKATNNITITNETSDTATLSFSYTTTNANSFKIAGASAATSGNYSVLLDAGASLEIAITSNSGFSGTTATLTLSNFILTAAAASSNVTFEYDSTLGSITVDGESVASGTSKSISVDGVPVSATAKNGATFLGWIDSEGKLLNNSGSYTLQPAADMTVRAVFAGTATTSNGWFLAGGDHLFSDLNTAATHAAAAGTKTVVLMNNATLPAGNYTIPAGVTLLIPRDAVHTVDKTTPGIITAEKFSEAPPAVTAFRKLTMASGANITVNGSISVAGNQRAGGLHVAAAGAAGFIHMNSGSAITVNNGGFLYAWGYITGSGSVTAKSGATVYEQFQVGGWRGGDVTLKMNGNKYGVFPMSQYYVQNIEVPLKLESGAIERTLLSVSISVIGVQKPEVAFVGTKDSMFTIESGYIIKDYIESEDRLLLELHGGVTLSSIDIPMKLGVIFGNVTFESSKYELPLNGNITIHGIEGTATIGQDVALLPGARVIIDEGVTCTLSDGTSLYAYDKDEWGNYCGSTNAQFHPVYNAPGRTHTRTAAELVDASICINGTIDASKGYLYTTAGAANVHSTGAGVVKTQAGVQENTYQVTQADPLEYPAIPISSVQLKNADGTYVETGKGTEVATYIYTNGVWVCQHKPVTDAAIAPTCTDTGLTEGSHCSVCGEVLVAQEKVAANGHSFSTATGNCGVCGEAMGVVACWIGKNTTTYYQTLAAAVAAYNAGSDDGYIQMQNDTTESDITATRDLYLNLNGKNVTVTGTFKMGEHVLYGMDSTTDGLTDSDYGVISGTVSGTVETVHNSEQGPNVGRLYVSYTDNAGLSFHRIRFGINSCTYYQKADGTILDALTISAIYKGDTQALEKMSDFGMAVSVADTPINSGYEWNGAESEVFETVDGKVTNRLLAYLLEGYATGVLGQKIGAEALLKIGDIQISADVVTIDMANIGTQGGA